MNSRDSEKLPDWIADSAAGDHSAFQHLYNHIADDIFHFIIPRTSTRDDAKDLLQEVLLDIWNAMPSFTYKSEKQFWSFVYTITRRKLAKYYDSSRIHDELDPRLGYESRVSDTVHSRLLVVKVIEQLPKKLRIVIELRYFLDLPFAEIAMRLGEKEGTVKVRHHRALKKLSQLDEIYE